MIFDSRKWRKQLRDAAVDLTRRSRQQRWSGASLSVLERELMLAFYTVRKLIESHRTHSTLASQTFRFPAFRSLGKPISYVIWPDVSTKYDLSKHVTVAKGVGFIANQFIHSFVFRPTRTQAVGLSGVFTVSDWEKDRQVFWFDVAILTQVLLIVANSRSSGFRVAPERNEMLYP